MAEHDSSYKFIFSHASMVEDLMRGFVQEEWVKDLDFSTLEKMSGSYVSFRQACKRPKKMHGR